MLLDQAPLDCPCVLVDPNASGVAPRWITTFDEPASQGVPRLADHWLSGGRLRLPE